MKTKTIIPRTAEELRKIYATPSTQSLEDAIRSIKAQNQPETFYQKPDYYKHTIGNHNA